MKKEELMQFILECPRKIKGSFTDQMLYSRLVREKKQIDISEYNSLLSQLIEDKFLFYQKGWFYLCPEENPNLYVGTIQVKEKGYGFFQPDGKKEEFYIPEFLINGAFDSDRVLVYCDENFSMNGMKRTGEVLSILERGITTIVGLLKKDRKTGHIILLDDNPKHHFHIELHKSDLNGAQIMDKVLCDVTEYHINSVRVKVQKILGNKDELGMDILSCVVEHNVPYEFDKGVIESLKELKDDPEEKDYVGRKDFRANSIITIDGEDAKDFDDAIEVRYLEDKKAYFLGVHIADVSHYVTPYSLLDQSAYQRGTSIYLLDRVIPMIPEKLSNGLCSLMEGRDRLTLSCLMEFNLEGELISSEICKSVICSKHRTTYTQMNSVLEGTLDFDLKNMILEAKHLSDILEKKRKKRGAIDFDGDESKMVLDDSGRVKEILPLIRGESERIIESFMLEANETVAKTIHQMDLPFLYRIHEEPDKEKLTRFIAIITNLGYNYRGTKGRMHPLQAQEILEYFKGSKEEKVISDLLLRSMAKARYSTECLGHYGLSMDDYCHFTSPIRRYPDLVVHRLLKDYILNNSISEEVVNDWQMKLPEIARSTSKCERTAIEIEREVEDMKKAEYMSSFLGQKFIGIVSSITSFGVFVELENTCEGMIPISQFGGRKEYYEFDEEHIMLIGERSRDVIELGDSLEVEVSDASKVRRTVDFDLIKILHPHKYQGRKNKKR